MTKTTSALQLVVLKTCDKQEQYHFARGYLRDVTIISISCVLSILCDIDKLYYRYCELVYAIVIVSRLPVIIFYVTTPQLPASSLLGSESWSSSATFPSSASPSAVSCLLLVCSSSSYSSPSFVRKLMMWLRRDVDLARRISCGVVGPSGVGARHGWPV